MTWAASSPSSNQSSVVPLTRGIVVEARERQPPLPAVGDQRQMLAPRPKPAQDLADHAAAAPYSDALGVVDEDG